MAGSGVHGKGLVPNVRSSNTLGTVSKQAGRYQRKERATRLLELLLPPKGKALFEDLDPRYWRMSCMLVVEDLEDAILLSNNLLNCPPCVQRRCALGQASGEESFDCRQQIGQRAGVLWTLSRRRIHVDKDVDCGSQWEDIEDVDVIVCPCQTTCEHGPGTEQKSVHCGEGEQRRQQSLAGGERIFARCICARMREEVPLESTAGGSPTPVQTNFQRPAKTLRGNIGRAEASCPARADVCNLKKDGCRDADG